MQDERHALGGGEPVEYHQQGTAHRLGHRHLFVGGRSHGNRTVIVGAEHFRAAFPLPESVEALVGGHRGEPAGRIGHLGDAAPADLQPRGLHRIVGVMHRAEQSVGDLA